MEKEMKDAGIETCSTDIPVGECGEGAPSLPSVGKGGVSDDDISTEPLAIDDPAQCEQNFSDPIHYDPKHPPLALEPALRPMPTSPAPAPDSVPTFIPISEKEYERMNKYIPQGLADPLPDTILRRRLLNVNFNNCSHPFAGRNRQNPLRIRRGPGPPRQRTRRRHAHHPRQKTRPAQPANPRVLSHAFDTYHPDGFWPCHHDGLWSCHHDGLWPCRHEPERSGARDLLLPTPPMRPACARSPTAPLSFAGPRQIKTPRSVVPETGRDEATNLLNQAAQPRW